MPVGEWRTVEVGHFSLHEHVVAVLPNELRVVEQSEFTVMNKALQVCEYARSEAMSAVNDNKITLQKEQNKELRVVNEVITIRKPNKNKVTNK